MKKVFGILAAGAFAACSSSTTNPGGTPPTPTTYSYGTGTPVSQGSQQAAAASTAQSQTQSIVSATQSGTVTDNAATLSTAPDLPISLTSDLGAALVALPKNPLSAMVGSISKATRSGEIVSGCYTVSGNTITYNNCNYSQSGFTYSVNGTLTATATNITWNINVTLTYSSSSDTLNFTGNETGNLNITTTTTGGTIDGTATTGFSGNESAGGNTYNFAYTAQVVFTALTFDNTCDTFVVGGKLAVSVTVAASSGSSSPGFENFGYQFSWTGCDTGVLVATGTAG
jgi:hypothetical protein